MSPRRSVSEAMTTRSAIVARAVTVASTQGLEGLTIGRLAEDLSLSKSGLLGHFGSKQNLQLAVLEDALRTFTETVWQPSLASTAGLPRLRAICRNWLAHLEGEVFPGGCFVTAASAEFDGRPGPVRDRLAGAHRQWLAALEQQATRAVSSGELPRDTDAAQLAFELNALFMGANQALQLHHDRAGLSRASAAMDRALHDPPRNSGSGQ